MCRFYVQWCPADRGCVDWMVNTTDSTSHDNDYSKVTLTETGNSGVQRMEPAGAAELVKLDPAYIMWNADETSVEIKLKGHGALSENSTSTVTLAGQACDIEYSGFGDMIQCQVVGPMDPVVQRGPVRVDYGPSDASLLHDGVPFAVAQTRVTVEFGRKFLIVGKDGSQCDPRPLPIGDGRLRGIASGGHLIPVQWSGLDCVDESRMPEMLLYHDRRGDGFRMASVCLYGMDDSIMACQAPSVVPRDRSRSPLPDMLAASKKAERENSTGPLGSFRCGFKVNSKKGDTLMVPCAPGDRYTVYPDPVFSGFTVTAAGKTIVIWGKDLVRGFVNNDVRVRLASGVLGFCKSQLVAQDRIECNVHSSLSEHVLHDLKHIWVDVGHMPVLTVNRTIVDTGSGGQP